MGENTAIEWADHSFNPRVGCTKISAACDHCYAEGWARRTGNAALWQGARHRTAESTWRQPLRWDARATREGRRHRVFCASLADVFDNQVPEDWRVALWRLIQSTPSLDWLLLTKRPQNIPRMLPKAVDFGPRAWINGPWHNVWLGTTVENQAEADRRIPHLLAVPASKYFLSCEPLLGPIDLAEAWHGESAIGAECWGDCGWCENGHPPLHNCQRGKGDWERGRSGIDWVIAGGESGPGARPSHPDWFRALRDQCAAAGVPFFFKQWGEWAPETVAATERGAETAERISPDGARRTARFGARREGEVTIQRNGKTRTGALLDGREHLEVPGA